MYLQVGKETAFEQALQIKVFNALGTQTGLTQAADAVGTIELNQLSGLPYGVYWVRVQAPGLPPVTHRVVLQR